jgi:hypothetical protein
MELLSREVGLKSEIETGLWVLGAKVMKEELILERQISFA